MADIDLMAALRASIERAREDRAERGMCMACGTECSNPEHDAPASPLEGQEESDV
jgi:hypothetical protein